MVKLKAYTIVNVVFALLSSIVSFAFGMWAIVIHEYTKDPAYQSPTCPTSTIRTLTLVNGFLSIVTSISSFLSFVSSFMKMRYDDTTSTYKAIGVFSTINVIFKCIMSTIVFCILVALSSYVWGTSCRSNSTWFFEHINLYLIVYWTLSVIISVLLCCIDVVLTPVIIFANNSSRQQSSEEHLSTPLVK
ncbi:hypothetical protein AKO1_010479 [Acrasis kona]|uniref:Uncharacterized protein n=1 Tax=Acrasis kona TaxID=1008807 RepID=A0AAW2ZJK1_9EUKA